MRLLLLSPILAIIVYGSTSHAQAVFEVEPILVSDASRTFLEQKGPKVEKTLFVEGKGSAMVITYSSDASLDLEISFPFETYDGKGLQMNPVYVLQVSDLQPIDRATVSIDLKRSPAWSPSREMYILTLRGVPESTVLVHDIHFASSSLLQTLSAFFHQFFVQEPVLLSSINFLWGYRVGDMSFSLLWGLLFFGLAMVVWSYGCMVRKRSPTTFQQWNNGTMEQSSYIFLRAIAATCLIFLLLYDARLSLDLLRASAQDFSEWYTEDRNERQYRQLGPVHGIADFLAAERETLSHPMMVAMCFDGTDFLLKQLRYLLYPTPADRAGNVWSDATHLIMIDTAYNVLDDHTVSCGMDTPRKAVLLKQFPQNSRVFRFTDSL